MDTQKLSIAIQAFIKKQSTNAAYYEENWNERKERKAYYQYDNYLETTLVGLEHCPMFMTANDLQKVSPILADRYAVIHFPNANAARIKSISHKYADKKLASDLYSIIKFDYDLMDKHIDNLVSHDVTSLRKHQQMIEAVLENALNIALIQDTEEVAAVTEDMFAEAEIAVLGAVKHRVGF